MHFSLTAQKENGCNLHGKEEAVHMACRSTGQLSYDIRISREGLDNQATKNDENIITNLANTKINVTWQIGFRENLKR